MSEVFALARLAVSSSRTAATVLVAVMILGASIGWRLESILGDASSPQRPWLLFSIFWSFLPAGLASFVLFDFSSGNSINAIESNCSHWVLRMPIRSWKIAVVPSLLKTIWIGVIWCSFAVLISERDGPSIPMLVPSLIFSSVAIWALAIAWRPMRWAWLRFIGLPVAAVASFALLIVYMNASQIYLVRWRTAVLHGSEVIAIANFAVAVFSCMRAIGLAKTQPDGIVPAQRPSRRSVGRRLLAGDLLSTDRTREFTGPVAALAWCEFAGMRDGVIRASVLFVIPSVLLLSMVFPMNVVTVTLAIVAFASMAGAGVNGSNLADKPGSSQLPPFLSRLPFSNATIAWTRMAVTIVLMIAIFSCIVFVFIGWSFWPSNRDVWTDWAIDQTAWVGGLSPTDGTPRDHWLFVGVGLSIMIVVSVSTMILGVTLGFAWALAAGRDWIAIAVATTIMVALLGLIGWFGNWFVRQSDWGSVIAGVLPMQRLVIPILVTLLVAKFVAAAAVSRQLFRANFASIRSIGSIWILWLLPVMAVTAILATSNPIDAIEVWHLAVFAILFLPLSGVLVLPIAMSFNRHR